MSFRWLIPLLLCLLPTYALAGEAGNPPPGRYLRSGGVLTVKRAPDGTLHFSIETVGANCHSCALDGTVTHGIGTVAGDSPDETCRIRLNTQGDTVEVQPLTASGCRNDCGMRASFDGDYHLPSAACTESGRRAGREAALRSYRARNYRAAAGAYAAQLGQCAPFMDWIEQDRLRNDLALAQFHAGDATACLKTLDATEAGGVRDEDALREHLPPCDFDTYLKVARATWHNRALCGGQ